MGYLFSYGGYHFQKYRLGKVFQPNSPKRMPTAFMMQIVISDSDIWENIKILTKIWQV